jgi:predicted MFS family arabinose efflux permease
VRSESTQNDSAQTDAETHAAPSRMPWFTLVLFATMGFVLVSAETMPAGLLPVIADDLGVSEGVVGQWVSVWALGTVVATVPVISLTRNMRRKPLLLVLIVGLVVTNGVTAMSSGVAVPLVSRFFAGAFTGIIWGLLAAYGRRISPEPRRGLALAIVSTGAPVGFALGTPIGAWLGGVVGWRWSFIALSIVAAVVLALLLFVAPDAPGQARTVSLPVLQVLRIPGVALVLIVIVVWMLAHNTTYTYIAPLLRDLGSRLAIDQMLFIYGAASIGGILLTAALIDRAPRLLLHGTAALFVVASLALLVGGGSTIIAITAGVIWGVSFGGVSAQLQSALSIAGGDSSDIANSFLPVAFNVAIFIAGVLGAALVGTGDARSLALNMTVLGVVALTLTLVGRRTAFRRS